MTDRPTGPLNTEVLSSYFEKAGFSVKEMVRDGDNSFRMEFNFPDQQKAVAMRAAFAKNGGDMQTYYRFEEKPHGRGGLMSRERVLIPYESDTDLREFFNDVMDDYTEFSAETSEDKSSSYNTTGRKRNLSGRI